MRIIIAGGRHYTLTPADHAWLDALHATHTFTQVVSGGATGADKGGEEWAKSRGIPLVVMPADWKKHGRAAGPLRNEEMAQVADAVALFAGGSGTASMERIAGRCGLRIFKHPGDAATSTDTPG